MKIRMAAVIFSAAMGVMAATNVLQLIWMQPPGYGSKVYTATNLNGNWTAIGTGAPPYSVSATQSVAYFYVVVTPNNQMAGGGTPTNDAAPGATYLNTNTSDFWVNKTGGTNGWTMLIGG